MDRGLAAVAVGLTLLVVGLGASAVAAPDPGGAAADPDGVTTTDTVDPTETATTESTETASTASTQTSSPASTQPSLSGTLVGVQGSGGYMSGGYVELAGERVLRDSVDTYFDVSSLSDGRLLAAWMDAGRSECGPYESPCARTGFVVFDQEGAVVNRFSFPVRTSHNSEVHDVEALPDGGFVLTDMDRERVMIVRDGEVTWQWNASEFYEAPPDPTTRDWLHVNDVDRIGDGRFLVSVRNANQLLVLERRGDDGEVVEVINADRGGSDASCTEGARLYDADGDGDVRCGNPDAFREQHNPQWLGPGAVLVADSGNDRVVELHRRNGVWRPVWALTGANGRSFSWPRDADRLPNGNTLVTDSRGRRVVEVTESGETVWSYSTGNGIVYEADRLPAGERPRGPLYASDRPPTGVDDGTATDGRTATVTPGGTGTEVVEVGPGESRLPVFGEAARLVRAGLPWLPLWLRGPQVALSAASLLLVVGGVVDAVWRRR
ncbi:aryl-sulfate sulfotransferase [Halobaculum sp. MBLA0143]|uniref:aryl-sulfate sulfotransferase n=1 Tax=Halobaculum sp. MBLA0143 TaxID=3079933 RepID=UPI0035248E47